MAPREVIWNYTIYNTPDRTVYNLTSQCSHPMQSLSFIKKKHITRVQPSRSYDELHGITTRGYQFYMSYCMTSVRRLLMQ